MAELAVEYSHPFEQSLAPPVAKTWWQRMKTPDYSISTKKYPLTTHPDGCKIFIISLNFVDCLKLGKLNLYSQNKDFMRVFIGESARYAGKDLSKYVGPNSVCKNDLVSEDQKPKLYEAMVCSAFNGAIYTPKWLEKYPERQASYDRLHSDRGRIRKVFCNSFSEDEAAAIESRISQKVAKVQNKLTIY